MLKEIDKLVNNHTDYHSQVSGIALNSLYRVYGETLNQEDINRVIKWLEMVKLSLPANYEAATGNG